MTDLPKTLKRSRSVSFRFLDEKKKNEFNELEKTAFKNIEIPLVRVTK